MLYLIVLKILIGLFIWLYLPDLLTKKLKAKKNQKRFFNSACAILGLLLLFYAGVDIIKLIIPDKL